MPDKSEIEKPESGNFVKAKFFFRVCLYSCGIAILISLATGAIFHDETYGSSLALPPLVLIYLFMLLTVLSTPAGLIFMIKSFISKEPGSLSRYFYLAGLSFFSILVFIMVRAFLQGFSQA